MTGGWGVMGMAWCWCWCVVVACFVVVVVVVVVVVTGVVVATGVVEAAEVSPRQTTWMMKDGEACHRVGLDDEAVSSVELELFSPATSRPLTVSLL